MRQRPSAVGHPGEGGYCSFESSLHAPVYGADFLSFLFPCFIFCALPATSICLSIKPLGVNLWFELWFCFLCFTSAFMQCFKAGECCTLNTTSELIYSFIYISQLKACFTERFSVIYPLAFSMCSKTSKTTERCAEYTTCCWNEHSLVSFLASSKNQSTAYPMLSWESIQSIMHTLSSSNHAVV